MVLDQGWAVIWSHRQSWGAFISWSAAPHPCNSPEPMHPTALPCRHHQCPAAVECMALVLAWPAPHLIWTRPGQSRTASDHLGPTCTAAFRLPACSGPPADTEQQQPGRSCCWVQGETSCLPLATARPFLLWPPGAYAQAVL